MGVVSPTTSLPSGAGATKFVLLSIVVVPAPSGRLGSVPAAPSVSANAIAAPPCSTAGLVHRSGRTRSRARILSGEASTNSTPISSAKGSIASLIRVNPSMAISPSRPSSSNVTPAQAGVRGRRSGRPLLMPAFAGMTTTGQLNPTEARFALGVKGFDALAEILGAAQPAVALAFELDRQRQRRVLDVVEQLLCGALGEGRDSPQFLDEAVGRRFEF